MYTAGLTFSALKTAYIRLVNADTNQELARCQLGQEMEGDAMKKRVLLFAKVT